MKIRNAIKEFSLITLGAAIVACAVFFFLQPCHLALGSVTGIAIVLQPLIPLKVSVITMIINCALLVLGFLLVGREFGGKTVYTALLMPALIGVLEILFPENPSLTGEAFIDMVCYLFVVSFGQAILFARNASSGGLDIVGKILNKFFRVDIGKAIAMVGMCVAISAIFVYDIKTVVISVLGTYLNGMVLDHFIFGTNIKRRVCIISAHQEQILNFILNTLHSGATLYEARGAYTNAPSDEIITIVDKHEYRALMQFIAKTDPKAFVTVINVNEIVYQPKL